MKHRASSTECLLDRAVRGVTWALSSRPARWLWARHRRARGPAAKGHVKHAGEREMLRHMLVHVLHGEQWVRSKWSDADGSWWTCACEAPPPAAQGGRV